MRLILVLVSGLATISSAAPPDLDRYNVVWTTPSDDSSASMPIGDGVNGANVWVDPKGDLLVLLSRTDAWSETDRLLKLGRIRIRFDPPLYSPGNSFEQALVLREGRIAIAAGPADRRAALSVYFDMGGSSLRIEGDLGQPRTVSAFIESWRTGRNDLSAQDELGSTWTMNSAPPDVRRDLVWESADVIIPLPTEPKRGILWYHRNEHSVVPWTLAHQGLTPVRDKFPDPLINRTFGGLLEGISGSGLTVDPATPGTLRTAGPVPWMGLKVTLHAAQTDTVDAWRDAVVKLSTPPAGPDGTKLRTAEWWSSFWDRSWIFIDGDRRAVSRIPANTHPLRIGADSGGGNLFRGQMMRTTVYTRPLTDNDVRSLSTSRTASGRHVTAGATVSCDLDATTGSTDQADWPCLSAFGDRCAWTRRGLLRPTRDGDATAVAFEGGSLETVAARPLAFEHGLTLEAWIGPAKDIAACRIFDKLTAGRDDGFLFDIQPGDTLRLIVGDVKLTAPGVVRREEWQHVAATFDAETGRARIFVNGGPVAESAPATRWQSPEPPSKVTQAYVLQRWIQACGAGSRDGLSSDPIKFNGSIFTVEPPSKALNPDWRRWGGCFWWQNTRLPYYPMLASGDFDMMDPLFRFYEKQLPGSIARTKLYYGAEGVYWPETITSFGTYANSDYGWQRDGLAIGDISPCPWWQWAWNQSLELTQLMLDHGVYTGDEKFLRERAIPMARETLKYFDTRFARDEHGKYVISPTQAVETYWKDVVGDAPVIGGLRTVTSQLLRLPDPVASAEDRAFWKRVQDATPELPLHVRDGRSMASPAQKFDPKRSNCETPELYPLWPFREYDLARADALGPAREAFPVRFDKNAAGWTQDGIFAARLGLVEDAKTQLIARAGNSNASHRFPAIWGPNFDWLPDQCHGSNLLTQTQLMLLQADTLSDTILLLPAWPRDWDVSFKLHAPKRTTVEVVYRGGRIEKLSVQPPTRRADIVIPVDIKQPNP